MNDKIKILFLCTGNSCRSQMAEAWTNRLKGDQFVAYSAGVAPKQIDPRAVQAMAEVGIDISKQRSKDISSLPDAEFEYVVTLCDDARESCPYLPAKARISHRGFKDPPRLAEGVTDEEEAMSHYRRIRDEIKSFVEKLPESLSQDFTKAA
ncbi:MAG: arsenate reductase ArsC [Desulfobacteraceae bacterium]|nr:MAG: arsenate reductase ArsC [Desulfobacteraceae bacterium]